LAGLERWLGESPAGDEALLCLDPFWRNERWRLLFLNTRPQPVQELKCTAFLRWLHKCLDRKTVLTSL